MSKRKLAVVAATIFSGWLVVTRFSVTRELGILDICLFPCVSS